MKKEDMIKSAKEKLSGVNLKLWVNIIFAVLYVILVALLVFTDDGQDILLALACVLLIVGGFYAMHKAKKASLGWLEKNGFDISNKSENVKSQNGSSEPKEQVFEPEHDAPTQDVKLESSANDNQ